MAKKVVLVKCRQQFPRTTRITSGRTPSSTSKTKTKSYNNNNNSNNSKSSHSHAQACHLWPMRARISTRVGLFLHRNSNFFKKVRNNIFKYFGLNIFSKKLCIFISGNDIFHSIRISPDKYKTIQKPSIGKKLLFTSVCLLS